MTPTCVQPFPRRPVSTRGRWNIRLLEHPPLQHRKRSHDARVETEDELETLDGQTGGIDGQGDAERVRRTLAMQKRRVHGIEPGRWLSGGDGRGWELLPGI